MSDSFIQKILIVLSPYPFMNIAGAECVINDGFLVPYPNFCKKNFAKKNCKDIYASLDYSKKLKHNNCPHGFSIFTAICNSEKVALSGLIAFPENNYCSKEFRKLYNHNKIASEQIYKWFTYLTQNVSFFENIIQEKTKSAISSLHDIQKTNLLIKTNAESLINKQKGAIFSEKFESASESLQAIFKASELLSSQMELVSLFSNPDMITVGKKRQFEVFRFFDKIRQLYYQKAKTKGCTIHLKSPFSSSVQVYDSFALIPHILIDNAVKYSNSNENINVIFEENVNAITIRVKSTGLLILPEEKELIFEKFFKGKNSSTYSSEGSGIGLYVAKNIAEKHGGKLLVESFVVNREKNAKPAETTFILDIPKGTNVIR